jgi:hypothetical protein
MPHRFDQADDLAILDGKVEPTLTNGLVVACAGGFVWK